MKLQLVFALFSLLSVAACGPKPVTQSCPDTVDALCSHVDECRDQIDQVTKINLNKRTCLNWLNEIFKVCDNIQSGSEQKKFDTCSQYLINFDCTHLPTDAHGDLTFPADFPDDCRYLLAIGKSMH